MLPNDNHYNNHHDHHLSSHLTSVRFRVPRLCLAALGQPRTVDGLPRERHRRRSTEWWRAGEAGGTHGAGQGVAETGPSERGGLGSLGPAANQCSWMCSWG